MDDLISRQAAITLPIMPKEYRTHKPIDCDDAYEKGWCDCQTCIGRLPAAEPTEEQVKEFCIRRNLALIAVEDIETIRRLSLRVEPKKGKWISETGQYYQVLRCDQCGHVTVEHVRNYCPNCGARMEE